MTNPEPVRPVDKKIAAIIVNYNIAALAIRAIESLEPVAGKFATFSVHVVDNASPNQDAALLSRTIAERGWHDWVTLHAEQVNHGFAGGNNVALRAVLNEAEPPDYIFLLNPDAYVLEGAVEQMVHFMETHENVGIVGSRCEHPDGRLQASAFRFPSLLGEFEQTISLSIVDRLLARWQVAPPPAQKSGKADWVAGASTMIRRAVFEDIGLMDEAYFLYFEETDFMLNAARAGWATWYLHEARAVHLLGQSTKIHHEGADDEANNAKATEPLPLYLYDSWRTYYVKNHGRAYAIGAALAHLAGASLYRMHRFLLRRPLEQPANAISAFFRHGLLPLLREKAGERS